MRSSGALVVVLVLLSCCAKAGVASELRSPCDSMCDSMEVEDGRIMAAALGGTGVACLAAAKKMMTPKQRQALERENQQRRERRAKA